MPANIKRTPRRARRPRHPTTIASSHSTATRRDVSGKLKQIPDLPIVTSREDTVELRVLPKGAPEPSSQRRSLRKQTGRAGTIMESGCCCRAILKAAAAAFQKVTEADPSNPDGWVNLGRVAVQEGDMERARVVLQRALSLRPDLARANFFYARVLRSDGDYDGASAAFAEGVAAISQGPRSAQRDGTRALPAAQIRLRPSRSCRRLSPSIRKTCRPTTI